jgi:hypothetical protein
VLIKYIIAGIEIAIYSLQSEENSNFALIDDILNPAPFARYISATTNFVSSPRRVIRTEEMGR